MTLIQMDTDSVWIIGRVFTHGTEEDLTCVKDTLYPKHTLTPWSKYNDKAYIPPQNLPIDPLVDKSMSPIQQLQNADAPAFFGKLSAMMNYNPAILPQDLKMRQVLENIGFHFSNGTDAVSFDYNKLRPKKRSICKPRRPLRGTTLIKGPMPLQMICTTG